MAVVQAKIQKLVFDLETSVGVAEGLTSSNGDLCIIPAQDITYAADRGVRLIARDTILDGGPGGLCSTMGSIGGTMGFTAEIHDVGDVGIPYWGRLLLACGHEASVILDEDDQPVTLFRPSTRDLSGFTLASPYTPAASVTIAPASATFGRVSEIAGEVQPIIIDHVHGATGTVEFAFPAGDRATMACTFPGLLPAGDLQIRNTNTYREVGDFEGDDMCHPLVMKAATIEFRVDIDGADVLIDPTHLSNISFSPGASVPDVLDPRRPQGFGVSRPLFDTYPTVTFSLAATAVNQLHLLSQFTAGKLGSLLITIPCGGERSLTFNFPALQFAEASRSEDSGMATIDITARLVREAGDFRDGIYEIIWKWGTTPDPE